MTQAPTPGPLSGDDVKLLVKGDLLQWRGTAISLVSFHHANVMGVQVIDLRDGRRWTASPTALSFIGRPDPDAWNDHAPTDCICVTTGNGSEGCGICNETGLRAALAPTAPVEASGSEQLDAGFEAWLTERDLLPKGEWDWPSIIAMLDHHEQAIRPQPSGETREIARWDICNGGVTEDFEVHADPTGEWVKYADVEAFLSDRLAPVASGGQHSSGEGEAGREAIHKVIHELWQLLDDGETGADGTVTINQARYQEVSKAMVELEALVPDSAGPFWGGFPVNYFWGLK